MDVARERRRAAVCVVRASDTKVCVCVCSKQRAGEQWVQRSNNECNRGWMFCAPVVDLVPDDTGAV